MKFSPALQQFKTCHQQYYCFPQTWKGCSTHCCWKNIIKLIKPEIHCKNFDSLSQSNHGSIKNFIVHLCSAAVECEFTCPACFSGLSPINICNQFSCDLSNSSLKADFLTNASHLSIIDHIIFYVELFETIPDQAHIEATKHETTSHNHFLYLFLKNPSMMPKVKSSSTKRINL